MAARARRRQLALRAVSLAVVLATAGCGGDAPSPAAPAPPPTTLAPAPSAQPLSSTCARLPLGSDKHTCKDETASFYTEVVEAIDTLMEEHPEYFKGNTIANGGGYYTGLIRLLDRKGLCAAFDGQELAVKSSNEFSDQYRLQTSWGEVKRIYIGTCYPAVFPLSHPSLVPPPAGCPLPPSVEAACDRITPVFDGDVDAALEQLLRQRPELFDPSQGKDDRPLVKDMDAYYAALIATLAGKGYCAHFDGEEIQVKRTNEFTEHYDVNYQDRYVRRGPGAYRGSCYPAAF
jgi:hypothetical protein